MRYLSLFSGIEAATSAWHSLGWECAGVAEIEPFPSKVLRHHYPLVRNLGDVTKLTEMDIADLGHIDVVVFGSPCQDLSVAGKRKGLAGARSGLFFTALQIVTWSRLWCGTRFALWENVPGAFSSNKGADFAAVVDELSGLAGTEPPPKGWGTEGCAVGPEAMVEWSTLDAQWFGVAQRRRRVFALADFGNWAGRQPILLEPQGVRGDTAPRREAGQVAPTIHARSLGGGGLGTDFDCDGGLIAKTLSTCNQRLDCETETETFIVQQTAHTLRGEGFDASEDGTGRGTPLVPVPFDTTQITSKANRSNPQPGDPCHPLAAGAHPPTVAMAVAVCPTLRAGGNKTGGDRPPGTDVDTADSLIAYTTKLHNTSSNQSSKVYEEYSTSLDRSSPPPALLTAMQVRRLTPRECERLQGFPDDYTLLPGLKKPVDGPRYKALGNSMAVPVMRWIGRRIDLALLFQE